MELYDKIKSMVPGLADDGSKELAKQWMELLDNEKEIQILLLNKGFQRILSALREDFHDRMSELVKNDPELKAIKRMFIRTVGMHGTTEEIEKIVDNFLDEGEDLE